MQSITLTAREFKALVSAATRFPILGGIAGSELVSVIAAGGKISASTFGTVLSKARGVCQGDDLSFAVDDRLITSFASVCPESADVEITVDATIVFKSGNKEVTAPYTKAADHKMTPIKELAYSAKIELTEAIAKQLSFLSALAFSDSSRAELCCVMLTPKNAIACSQKAVAIINYALATENVAIPLPIARVLAKDDIVYVGPKETILKSGISLYAIPSPVKAQAEFPVAAIQAMQSKELTPVMTCDGVILAEALNESNKCLTAISRTEVVVALSAKDGKLNLAGENGGAKYKSSVNAVTAGYEKILKLPLVEVLGAAQFMLGDISISVGKQGGETIISTPSAWFLFPAWSGK